MLVNCYSIYDCKTEVYLQPMFCHNDEHAKRMVCLNLEEKSAAYLYPEDYRLFHVGTWNDHSGKLSSPDGVRFICDLKPLVDESRDLRSRRTGGENADRDRYPLEFGPSRVASGVPEE